MMHEKRNMLFPYPIAEKNYIDTTFQYWVHLLLSLRVFQLSQRFRNATKVFLTQAHKTVPNKENGICKIALCIVFEYVFHVTALVTKRKIFSQEKK